MSRHSRSLLGVFGAPLIIFVIGLLGLVLALLVDDDSEIIYALAVAVPILFIVWVLRRRL